MEPQQLTLDFENTDTAIVWIVPEVTVCENTAYASGGYIVKHSNYRYKCDQELDAIWFGSAPAQAEPAVAAVDYLAITRAVVGG
jgi:hypothetical protein